MIDGFTFGTIVIDGEIYRSDLMIYPDGMVMAGGAREGRLVNKKTKRKTP